MDNFFDVNKIQTMSRWKEWLVKLFGKRYVYYDKIEDGTVVYYKFNNKFYIWEINL